MIRVISQSVSQLFHGPTPRSPSTGSQSGSAAIRIQTVKTYVILRGAWRTVVRRQLYFSKSNFARLQNDLTISVISD